MDEQRVDLSITRLAALADPVRRGLYRFVAASPREVSRERAARRLRISRALAAFHLDKLVEQGLLEASYRRLTGRRGPGAGRPAKLYRRSPVELDISLPPRAYGLAARLLAAALPDRGRLRRAARARGIARGREARRRAGGVRTGPRALLGQLRAVLAEYGYMPLRDPDGGGAIRLRNCPFDALARADRSLVCGMNQALLDGVRRGLGLGGYRATLDPRPGLCCVAFRPGPKPRGG